MSVDINKQNKRIKEIKEKWFLLEPLYFMIFTTHNTVINNNIKTIRSGKGIIEYNPIFISNLSDKELETVIKSELLRIILKHPYSRRKEISGISYLASNITLKEYMKEAFFPSAEDIFLSYEYNEKYFEFYYDKLIEMANQEKTDNSDAQSEENKTEPNNEQDEQNNNTGQNEQENNDTSQNTEQNEQENNDNSKNTEQNEQNNDDTEQSSEQNTKPNNQNEQIDNELDNEEDNEKEEDNKNTLEEYSNPKSTGYENTENWDDDELMRNFVNDKINDAKENNSWGSITQDVQEKIIASCIPKADYRSILKAFRASVLSQKRRLTRMKPSRRYGFQYMGSRRDFSTKLLFAVDVSGSISEHDLVTGFSVVNRLFKYGVEEIDVIQFDTEIKNEIMTMKKAVKSIEILGRGGTSFQPLIDYIDQNRQYDGLIIFTDGYSYVPNKPKNLRTRILWLFNNERNYNYMEKILRSIGKCAFIK